MRNSLLISIILTAQISFSQKEIKDTNLNKALIFNVNNKLNNGITKNIFSEIKNPTIKDFKNNSEGKFSFNASNKELFKNDKKENNTEFLASNKAFKGVQLKTDNMNTSLKTEFVNKIIQKKIAEEILKYMIMNGALTYGDRYLNEYKDFTDLENKLILSKKITSKIELQIGKDIYPYLNKIQKTELDKTMQNRLNLFAINF